MNIPYKDKQNYKHRKNYCNRCFNDRQKVDGINSCEDFFCDDCLFGSNYEKEFQIWNDKRLYRKEKLKRILNEKV